MISSSVRASTSLMASALTRSHRQLILGATDATMRNFHSPAVKRYKKKKRTEPSMEMAKNMMASYPEMDNTTLVTIAQMDNHDARSEVLRRHIMAVDNVPYPVACQTFSVMAAKNREGMITASIPYITGASMGVIAAASSIPLVFDLKTAVWFNEHYVTTEVPDAADLETWLEVGSWTWNWMEPPLGQISFFLLCLQFSRAQMMNLGIRPYTSKLKHIRAKKLSSAYPQYDSKIVEAFSETDRIFPDPYDL